MSEGERRTGKGTDTGGEVDIAGAYIKFVDRNDKDLGTYLLSQLVDFQRSPDRFGEKLVADGKTYDLFLRFKREYKPYTLNLLDVQGTRYFNGLVAHFEQTQGDTDFDVYRVYLKPSLWQLTLATNCRVFQDQTVMDVIKAVISPYALSVGDVTSRTYKPMEYCTQYNETDFNFISRLADFDDEARAREGGSRRIAKPELTRSVVFQR